MAGNLTPKTTRLLSWEGPLPEVGDFLRTSAGSAYLILSRRDNIRPNAKSVAFMHLGKLDPGEELPDGATVHSFAWSPRG